jgi:beta-ureidopropionase
LDGDTLGEVLRVQFGGTLSDKLPDFPEAQQKAKSSNFHLLSFEISAKKEQLRPPRVVRIGAIQNRWPADPAEPILEQRKAAHKRIGELVDTAGEMRTQVLCLQEAWAMPFAFCTREKETWCEFAEAAGTVPLPGAMD